MAAVLIILGVILFFFLLYAFVLVRPRKRLSSDYAHRGLHGDGVPDNSLAAFGLAADAGYGIELDVQLSRDGEVMVFHDYTLSRMTGREAKLSELDAAELDSLRLCGSDEKIPRFSEVLSLVDGRVPILVELKGESLSSGLCGKVAPMLAAYSGPYIIESFNPLLLGKMAKLLPEAVRGILYTDVCKEKKKYSPLNIVVSTMATNVIAKPDFIAYDKRYAGSFALKLASSYGVPRLMWTVTDLNSHTVAKSRGEGTIFEGFCPEKR